MKKKIVSLALAVCLLAIAAVGTLAYFTDKDAATNTFTVGNVKIDLTETEWVDKSIANPGVSVAKNPVVENTGDNDAYIRLDVTLSDWSAFAEAAANHEITALDDIFGGFSAKWERYAETQDAEKDTMTYSYIYKDVVAAGDKTDAIFTSVTVPADFTSEEMAKLGDDFTIDVHAFAIQANGDQADLIAALKAMVAE